MRRSWPSIAIAATARICVVESAVENLVFARRNAPSGAEPARRSGRHGAAGSRRLRCLDRIRRSVVTSRSVLQILTVDTRGRG